MVKNQNEYHVVISEQAKQLMVSHAAFLAKVSPEAAERLVVSFTTAVQSLSLMPQRCPWLIGEYIPKNVYRFLLCEKRYLLIFQIQDDIVYVDYIVDCREDYSWLIR